MTVSLIQEAQPPLRRDALADNPVVQFERWYAQAEATGVPDREAMSLATVSPEGVPSARMVLLREVSPEGFTFYTNYTSRKARDMAGNASVQLLSFWPTVYRQIRIQGTAVRVPASQSEAYFRSRPRGSQVGAWASFQSAVLPNREALYERYRSLEQKFAGQDVPVPGFWGGYCVHPESVEFWQGQPNRLHDRFRYRKDREGWIIERLSP